MQGLYVHHADQQTKVSLFLSFCDIRRYLIPELGDFEDWTASMMGTYSIHFPVLVFFSG